MRVEKSGFGRTAAGEPVHQYRLEADRGVVARVIDYGATLTALEMPDARGRVGPVVLGFDGLEPYLVAGGYLGATVGRFANRIAGGRFAIRGQEHHVTRNEGRNHLHGGARGFDKVIWSGEAIGARDEVEIPAGTRETLASGRNRTSTVLVTAVFCAPESTACRRDPGPEEGLPP